MSVRPSEDRDIKAIAAIYAQAVIHGTGTFEETPPSPAEMATRRARILGHGLPHLVFDHEGRVLGFASATPFRPRPAYRYTAEDSVYVVPEAQGAGVGRALLAGVIAGCEALGLRQLLALVGDSDNAGSLALHAALGFARVGTLPAVGFKHGRWLDAVWMRRALNAGEHARPDAAGLMLSET